MMRRLIYRAACATLVALTLCACAVSPPTPDIAAVGRKSVPAFELDGRLAASDGERAANGTVSWAHTPRSDTWTVYSPLGQIVAQLISTGNGATLLTADGHMRQASDVNAILPEMLGVSAPLDGLPHWVQAAPRRGARVLSLDDAGRPSRIADDGWIIDYPEYADASADAPPRRIDAAWGDTRIRLIIDQWTPHP